MIEAGNSPTGSSNDKKHEGRDDFFMDIDRMVNEGLGGGQVTLDNGLIEETTTDTMEIEAKE
ncbi:hypothetical protein [Paenibacillus sp. R14(2021)]|uniref:hypothetical protein n=1 Tax=Paenibacillus sp. R14(2021) TaxID=2859228 RepID=UPI001C611F82|nr:hypothetical protein [Paenibacillus sp. R14(2021)]